jgi:hypothetical protein
MIPLSQAWANFNGYLAIGIFFAYFVLDILSVYYTLYVMRFRSIASANIVVALYLISAFGVINYVGNYLYIVPVALGAWLGTYATVEWEKRKDGIGERHRKVGM